MVRLDMLQEFSTVQKLFQCPRLSGNGAAQTRSNVSFPVFFFLFFRPFLVRTGRAWIRRTLPLAVSLYLMIPVVSAEDWIPEGFEDLANPQETVVDVFYGGVYLASVTARFEPGSITVLDSLPVVARLPDLLDPLEFSRLIEFPLDTNAQLRCRTKRSIDCGKLLTRTVGVIFDQGRLKLDLFIGPELLQVQTLEQLRYLPKSDAGFSAIDDMSFYASGSTDSDLTFNMANSTLVSFAETRLRIDSNLTSEDDLTIDTFALQREVKGLDYQAGIFRANAGSFLFMQNQQFLGATFGSSLTTRLDLELALGTTFTVFLNSRSLVQIYKDDRLLGSSYYDTGNQEINTASLPSGAYDVELRITDSSGLVRVERRFYSKNTKIPPEGEALFFIQAGQYVETVTDEILPQTTEDRFVRAGYSRRLFTSTAASLGFSADRESTMVEGGLFHQRQKYEVSAALAFDEHARIAGDIRFRYRYENGNVNISARKISGGDLKVDEVSQLGAEITQANISAYFSTENYGSFSVFGDYAQTAAAPGIETVAYRASKSKSYGARWSPPAPSWMSDLSGNVELSSNDGEILFLVNLRFGMSNGPWKTSASAIYQTEQANQLGESQSLTGSIDTRWQRDTVAGNDYAFSVRADHQQQDAIASSFQAKTHRGAAGFTAKHNIDANSWEYTGSMSTRFASTASGIYLGGKRSGNSGFVVKVEGPENSDNLIEVKMNGSTKAMITANKEVFIPTAAYRTYDISFSSSGKSIESINYKGRPMTIYPGNVVPIQATLTQVLIGIGRVILRSGEPLQNALIKGVEGLALTDGNGMFQTEMVTGTKQLTFAKGGAACTIRLPEYRVRRNVARLGKLICDLRR